MSFFAFVPRPVPGFQVETLDDEIILLHPVLNLIIHSNQGGALIWSLCDGQRSVAEIVELISAAYPESADDIAADVPQTIQELLSRGALVAA
ncbi:MAG: hypothetical protein Fur0016_04090 [Anaerolineales bacterium]